MKLETFNKELSGERISQLRQAKGLSLEELGQIAGGVSKSTVSRWENGQIDNMKRESIALLANYFKVSPIWIMGFDVPKFPPNENEKHLREEIDDSLDWMKEEDLKKLLDFIKQFFPKRRD